MREYDFRVLWRLASLWCWVDEIDGREYRNCLAEWYSNGCPMLSVHDVANWVNGRGPGAGPA